MKSNNITTKTTTNLIGENNFKQFLEIQALYGYAQRGGIVLPSNSISQQKRLIHNVNILESSELKKLVFNELFFGN